MTGEQALWKLFGVLRDEDGPVKMIGSVRIAPLSGFGIIGVRMLIYEGDLCPRANWLRLWEDERDVKRAAAPVLTIDSSGLVAVGSWLPVVRLGTDSIGETNRLAYLESLAYRMSDPLFWRDVVLEAFRQGDEMFRGLTKGEGRHECV